MSDTRDVDSTGSRSRPFHAIPAPGPARQSILDLDCHNVILKKPLHCTRILT